MPTPTLLATQVTAANSLAFSPDGAQLAAGGNKVLRVFDTATPGRSYRSLKTFARKQGGQPGVPPIPRLHTEGQHYAACHSPAWCSRCASHWA